jgi:hypothetical protein
VLNDVTISFGSGNISTKGGIINDKNKIKNPANFNDWVFAYSLSNNSNRDNG